MNTHVLIIGAGTTGTGIARDLSLRGIQCVLVDKGDINAGASGANHGLLHSGARYVFKDGEAAVECRDESRLLKHLAPQCIEDTGGLFVAVEMDDDNYIADFPGMCDKYHIPCKMISTREARELEPCLAPDLKAAFAVEDAVVDPFMLSLDNAADAQLHGTTIMRNTAVTGFRKENGQITSATVLNTRTGETQEIEALQYVNATGAWADTVSAMAGVNIPMIYSKGSLLVTQDRINQQVINRLRRASDADILVPGGTVSIIGTTSVEIDSLDEIRPTPEEVDSIIKEGAVMVPELEKTRYIRAYAGVRPLVSTQNGQGRSITRNYTLKDHLKDGLENFISITGGKLTTYRLMAEKASDIIARRLKNYEPCLTAERELPASKKGEWTEPAKSARLWMNKKDPKGTLICECEMVSEQMVNHIVDSLKSEGARPTLREVGNRSRIGKGPCQGTFCSFRLASYLYGTEELVDTEGLEQVREFVNERWKGFMPLVRDKELMRVELQESFLCGLFGLEKEIHDT
ncbi:MAG: anaerobic glycerol-3-phosphate dehydrogenase subunit A [Desulfobacteraceae bacterium]|nr:MAG: anaerobic glycerol-3-phosphate dehydrogenase subunit A [Desulfobacteraceae bacterium]